MKIPHRIPDSALTANMTGRVDPEYEREVELHTSRRERAYEEAQKRLVAAERRAAKRQREVEEAKTARERSKRERDASLAWELVEFRRQELLNLDRLMRSAPAAATHRGIDSFRKVPVRHGGDF